MFLVLGFFPRGTVFDTHTPTVLFHILIGCFAMKMEREIHVLPLVLGLCVILSDRWRKDFACRISLSFQYEHVRIQQTHVTPIDGIISEKRRMNHEAGE